jgi:hypothetical protein
VILTRRTVLRAALAAAAACTVPGCAPRAGRSGAQGAVRRTMPFERLAYGGDPQQYGELRRPGGAPAPVVVVVHGGFWLSQYDLGLINYPVLDREQRLAYWEQSKLYLGKIAALCREHGVRMILLAIPPVERLKGETHLDEPYAVLDDIGKELAIPVVQLLPDFLGQSPDVLYYPYDRHWTPEGQRQAAQVLDRELRHLDVLPN